MKATPVTSEHQALMEGLLGAAATRALAYLRDSPRWPVAPAPSAVEALREIAAVIERVQREGTCWCGGTEWQGRVAMRISVSSWATTDDDVTRSLEAIRRAAQVERPT
jgi:hypothetical protein